MRATRCASNYIGKRREKRWNPPSNYILRTTSSTLAVPEEKTPSSSEVKFVVGNEPINEKKH
ncbi:hypothetical protein PsorP6_011516 [Peronosclerospora sorghi]|uniref:Uncharacterized protein n=1 Tax=Peronosclerospora sorghi TaxID=230839 RepID=A0ACC0WJT0_9STRA|nr:hypothetical protein PsorP6_011516 [Peronosclerospora sorghi]